MSKRLIFVLVLGVLLTSIGYGLVDFNKVWVPLAQISISYTNFTSIDENNNQKIDKGLTEEDLASITANGASTSLPIVAGGLTSNGDVIVNGDLDASGYVNASNGFTSKGLSNFSDVVYIYPDTSAGRVYIGSQNGRAIKVKGYVDEVATFEGANVAIDFNNTDINKIWQLRASSLGVFVIQENENGPFRFVVENNTGNVGIGTTDPVSKFEIIGYSEINSKLSSMRISSGAIGIPTNIEILTSGYSGENSTIFIGQTDYRGFIRYDNVRDVFIIGREDNGINREVISIPLNSDNVGIATTSPSERLYVVGNIYATGTITQGSDVRLKQNLVPLTGVLSKIAKINAYSYEWNALAKSYGYEGDKQIGLVAQELEQQFPELVKEVKHCKEENGKEICESFKTIDYEHAVAVLWQGLKEANEELMLMKQELCEKDSSYSFC